MRNKLIAIAAASVLPLGFAASASAEDPTATHAVTYVVAAERSISVAVNEGVAVDFGAIRQTGTISRPGAVTVTFSTPSTSSNKDYIEVRLYNSVGSGTSDINGYPKVTLQASAQAIAGSTVASNNSDVNLGGSAGTKLYGDFEEAHFVAEFDVDFKLTTSGANVSTEPQEKYVVRYSLLEATS
jgi:hypothetical protein